MSLSVELAGSSHKSKSGASTITGMGSWHFAEDSFAAVVAIVQVSTGS
jgi:hypothetical protein